MTLQLTNAKKNVFNKAFSSSAANNNQKNKGKLHRNWNDRLPSALKSSQVFFISPYPPRTSITSDDADDSIHSNAAPEVSMEHKRQIASWGLPSKLVDFYHRKGIRELFQWQMECLDCQGVLQNRQNLVFSAPTSAGKSMVADILMYKTLFQHKKKTIIILPFVSIAHEKVQSLKQVLRH
jgi:CRISPR/Cas system-associated endonuclease/helicase Cas3